MFKLATVLFEMLTVPEDEELIPLTCWLAIVLVAALLALMLFAVLVLPTVLPLIVFVPLVV